MHPVASGQISFKLPKATLTSSFWAAEVFQELAADLEVGSACRLYRVTGKPDVSRTPVLRFDLLALEKYTLIAVQFSRGCPFTCEFCDSSPNIWRSGHSIALFVSSEGRAPFEHTALPGLSRYCG